MSLFLFKKSKDKKADKESSLGISRKYKLQQGRAYVVEESPPDISFDAFANLINTHEEGKKPVGLAVTRQHPDLVRQKYGLERTPIYWLATKTGPDVIAPTNLGILTHTLINFVEEHENGVILLDGIEYLVSNNDFAKVLRMIDQVNDHISQSSTLMILPVDPRAFETKEVALLERNMERMPGIGDV
jgi:two-component system cell cycle response regulator